MQAPEEVIETSRADARTRLLKGALSLLVVGLLFGVFLPQVADFGEVWQVLREMTWLEAATLSLAAAWNLVTYWVLMMVALPGLSLAQAMVATETSTAIANTMPGGPAFGMGITYRMFSSWGFPRRSVTMAVTVSGLADLFAKLAMPAAAVVVLIVTGDAAVGLLPIAAIGLGALGALIGVFWMTLSSETGARRAGSLLQRAARPLLERRGKTDADWGQTFAAFRGEVVALLSSRRWWLVGASLLSHISLFLVLLLALRHVGVGETQIEWDEALGAFAFIRFLSAVPITPGGLGVVELGLSAALVYAGGPRAEVVAAVLVFRALTFLIQIPFGALTCFYWQHSSRWRRSPRPSLDTEPSG